MHRMNVLFMALVSCMLMGCLHNAKDKPGKAEESPTARCTQGEDGYAYRAVYRDADNDGYGAGAPSTSCMKKEPPQGYALNGTDCDDKDPLKFQFLPYFYRDEDGDRFTRKEVGEICAGLTLPPTFSRTPVGIDGDDHDPKVGNLLAVESGYLDSSFGTNGVWLKPDEAGAYLPSIKEAMAIDSTDRVLFLLHKNDNSGQGAYVIRLTTAGAVDLSFGDQGVLRLPTYTSPTSFSPLGVFADNSHVWVLGYRQTSLGGSPGTLAVAFQIRRFNSDGTPDVSFGSNGLAELTFTETTDTYFMVNGVAKTDDAFFFASTKKASNNYKNYLTIRKFNLAGELVTAFGTEGLASTEVGSGMYSQAGRRLLLDSQNRVVASGGWYSSGYAYRFLSDGTVDLSFGRNGAAVAPLGVNGDYDIALDSLDRVNVCGGMGELGMLLMRIGANGFIDSTFGTSGKGYVLHASPGMASPVDLASTCLITPQGKVLISGNSRVGLNADATVWRLNADGTMDSAFGEFGGVTYKDNLGGGYGYDSAVLTKMDSQGRMVTLGTTSGPDNTSLVFVMRQL